MSSSGFDAYLTYEFIKRLATPFEEMDAFKFGIIDDKGKLLKSPKGSKEKKAYSYFDKLIVNLKRIMGKFGLNSKFASYSAALFLLREDHSEFMGDESYLYEGLLEQMAEADMKTFKQFMEEAPVNATGPAVAGTDGNVHWSKKQPRLGPKGNRKKYGQALDGVAFIKRNAK